jgi:hypothetical protein
LSAIHNCPQDLSEAAVHTPLSARPCSASRSNQEVDGDSTGTQTPLDIASTAIRAALF